MTAASAQTDRVAVTVAVVNFNSGDKLRACLNCLEKQTFKDFDVIVVDNASEDDSLALAAEAGLPFRLIRLDKNLGFAAANNLAARQARGEWLATLNPDAYAEPDWLETVIGASRRYPQAEAFGSTQFDAAAPTLLDGAGDVCSAYGFTYRGDIGRPATGIARDGECFAPCAAAAFYRRDRFLDLGGFDERFFCYAEDVDLGWRLRLAGGRAIQLRDAVVRHEGSAITGRHSPFSVYYGHRNRIWLYYKNTPLLLYLATAPLRLAADLALGLQAALRGRGGPYFRAMIDGYGGLAQFNKDRAIWAKRGTSGEIARLMSWAPWSVFQRRAKLFPVRER
jgi:N-acetylglucosaminyl-diphospho-decaprenol L-rhamnosyltransferase